MKKKSSSDGILVFDRYYSRKPISALLAVGRVLFCSCLSVFAMIYIFSQYEMAVSLGYIAAVSGISSALLSVLFMFVKRRFAIPALLLTSVWLVYLNLEDFWQRFTYFVDEAMLLVEGRFLYPRGYILHNENRLTEANPFYCDGILLGSLILCCLFSLVCTASMKKRIRTFPTLIMFLLLCVPRILSETLEINLWFVPVALLFAASVAIEINYNNGLAVVRDGGSVYLKQFRQEEKSFARYTKKAPFFKRLGMRLNFYSKYSTSGAYSAVAFGLALVIGFSVFGEGKSIDYSELYNIFVDSADDVGDNDGQDGPLSEYFSSPRDNSDTNFLNVTSPGTGENSVLSVTFTGDDPIYLRGDIGINYENGGWTTSVSDNDRWLRSPVADSYRPCELNIFSVLLDVMNESGLTVSTESSVTIDYLCETDVVFLPSYTAEYSYYNNPSFDVYGDYSVRVSEAAGNYINSVQCTALLHKFGSTVGEEADVLEEALTILMHNALSVNDFYGTVIPEMASRIDVLDDYSMYVDEIYTKVPWELYDSLVGFLKDNELYDKMFQYSKSMYADVNDSVRIYNAAQTLNDFLKENYAYSLSGENSGDDAIIQFLNETKEGHCALYASAMTLLLRTVNIPARYCTGFSIYPDMIIGNRTELKEKNLHAWVEVYIDEVGWVTFDPTSAAIREMSGASDTPPEYPDYPKDNETVTADIESTDIPTEDVTNDSSPDNKPTAPPDNPASEEVFKLPTEIVILIISTILFMAVLTALVLYYRSVKRRAEEAIYRAEVYPLKNIYSCIVDIMHSCGMHTKHGQLPSDYYKQCDELFNLSLSEHRELLESVAFGADETDTEKGSILKKLLADTYSAAIKKSGIFRRHSIRRIVISIFLRSSKIK